MNEGIHLDLDTWIVPGQIRKANLCRGKKKSCFCFFLVPVFDRGSLGGMGFIPERLLMMMMMMMMMIYII